MVARVGQPAGWCDVVPGTDRPVLRRP